MFKKLVSNLPFSPGLVDQLGFYLRRLRQEEFIRRVGMIFTALSIAVQVVSMMIPPTHAETGNQNNIVYGSITSKSHMLAVWDNGDTAGNKDIDDIFLHYGITRADIANSSQTTMNSADKIDGLETWSIGRRAYGRTSDERAITITTNEGKTIVVYERPWARTWGTHVRDVLRGTTASGKKFAVVMNCGNPVVVFATTPPPVTPPPVTPPPVVPPPVVTNPQFTKVKTASNITQGLDDATTAKAKPGDEIVYNLVTANVGDGPGETFIAEDIADILEYADLTDDGGADFDSDKQTLTWGTAQIAAESSVKHSFIVKVKNPLPKTAQSKANLASFDLTMTNVYGNTVNIKLPKPPGKHIEQFATTLPKTGPAENALFISLFVLLVFFFYFRNRMISKELKILKRDYNGI